MTDTSTPTETVRVTIDGHELDVPKGTLVIRAAEMLGITVPRFCDHPLLDPIGACRQCMVEVEGQAKPFTSCTTGCNDGMVVKTHRTSELAQRAQEGQLEFLLINHPLDCPQCDKGGECPLQDQTLSHGPPDSRMLDYKRRYEKPIAISEQVLLDRERCVLCARCTRFSQQISGDPFIELFERGALEQVAIYEDEPYESYFSGNVIQICPVGALTSADYRFQSRPFDLTSHAGICNQCSAGCNLRVDVRRGHVTRQLARENMAVNEAWNCDKGRFGYPYVTSPERIREPRVRDANGNLSPTSWRGALATAATGLREVLDTDGPDAVGVLSGGRITDEDAYALSRFTRDVLGTDNVDCRLAPHGSEEAGVLAAVAGTTGPTYADVEAADVVIVAGLDVEEEVPILHLRLRKAWRNRAQKLVVVGPHLGSLDEIAWRWVRTPARTEHEALAALAPESAAEATTTEDRELAAVSEALDGAERIVVLAGERLASSPGALRSAVAFADARNAPFAWVPRRANSRGAVDAGLLPGLLPGGRSLDDPGPVGELWSRVPEQSGRDARGILRAAADGEVRALYLVGVDPARDFDDPALARAALARADLVIVQDLLPTDTVRHADVLLPAAAAQERVGSFTTWEGRRQPFVQALKPTGLVQRDWDITRQLALALGTDLGWETADDVRREAAPLMAAATPARDALRAYLESPQDGSRTPDADHASAAGSETLPPEGASPSRRDQEQGGETLPPEGASPSRRDDDRASPSRRDQYDVIIRDTLLGRGVMLQGADELLATAPPPAVEVNETDARRLGVVDGQHVAVVGPADQVELPARVTARVVSGCVVLPRNATSLPTPAIAGGADPLRVRLEPRDAHSPVDHPTRQDVAAAAPAAGQTGDARG